MNGFAGKTICCCRHRTLELSKVRQLSYRDLLRDPPVLHDEDPVGLRQVADRVRHEHPEHLKLLPKIHLNDNLVLRAIWLHPRA